MRPKPVGLRPISPAIADKMPSARSRWPSLSASSDRRSSSLDRLRFLSYTAGVVAKWTGVQGSTAGHTARSASADATLEGSEAACVHDAKWRVRTGSARAAVGLRSGV